MGDVSFFMVVSPLFNNVKMLSSFALLHSEMWTAIHNTNSKEVSHSQYCHKGRYDQHWSKLPSSTFLFQDNYFKSGATV